MLSGKEISGITIESKVVGERDKVLFNHLFTFIFESSFFLVTFFVAFLTIFANIRNSADLHDLK